MSSGTGICGFRPGFSGGIPHYSDPTGCRTKKALEVNKVLETPIYSPQEPFYAVGTCSGYPLSLDVAVTFGAHRLDFLANLIALLVVPIFLDQTVPRGPGESQQHTDYQ